MTAKAKAKASGKAEVKAPLKFKAAEPINVATILEPEQAVAEGAPFKKSISRLSRKFCSFLLSLDSVILVAFCRLPRVN